MDNDSLLLICTIRTALNCTIGISCNKSSIIVKAYIIVFRMQFFYIVCCINRNIGKRCPFIRFQLKCAVCTRGTGNAINGVTSIGLLCTVNKHLHSVFLLTRQNTIQILYFLHHIDAISRNCLEVEFNTQVRCTGTTFHIEHFHRM